VSILHAYRWGQFDLAGGDNTLDSFPAHTTCVTIDLMYEMHGALTFDVRDPETQDERSARLDACKQQLKAAA
jgi:hypothetical protein